MKNNELRKRTISLFGLVMLLMLVNGLAALFGLHYVDERHRAGLASLDRQMDDLETLRQAELHFRRQVQEWKNVLLRGHDPADRARYLDALDDQVAAVQDALNQLDERLAGHGVLGEAVPTLRRMHSEVTAGYRAALSEDSAALPDRARVLDARVRGIDRALADRFEEVVAGQDEAVAAEQAAHRAADEARYASLARVLVITNATGLILLLLILAMTLRRTDAASR